MQRLIWEKKACAVLFRYLLDDVQMWSSVRSALFSVTDSGADP